MPVQDPGPRSTACRWLIASCGALALAVPVRAQESWPYTVQRGDTLIGIAQAWLQEPAQWRALQRLNRVGQPRRLAAGRVLQIPVDWLRTEAALATLAAIEGTVERRRADGAFELLPSGATLSSGDELRTGPGGAALIELVDGSTVQLAPDSRLTLRQLLTYRGSGAAAAGLQLNHGRAESSVRPTAPRPHFELRTPVLTLGARGTEFRADAGAEHDRAEVTRGRVLATATTAADAARTGVELAAGFGIVGSGDGLRPPQPLLPAPDLSAVPARVERLPLRLAWAQDGRAVGWRAQVRDAADPRRLRLDGRFGGPAAVWPDLPDGDYVLRVRGIGALGLEGQDRDARFTLKARPEPPLTIEPRPDARSYGPQAQWRWSLSSAAASYRLQVTAGPDFAAPLVDRAGLPGPEVALPLAPGKWHWRIASVRADGDQGPWSDALHFEQREIPPPPAAAAAQVDGERLALRWSRRDAGDRYRLQLARDATFGELVLERELAEPEFALDGLSPGQYHLRLRTLDAEGYAGPWSAPSQFEVPTPLWWWLGPAALLLLLL